MRNPRSKKRCYLQNTQVTCAVSLITVFSKGGLIISSTYFSIFSGVIAKNDRIIRVLVELRMCARGFPHTVQKQKDTILHTVVPIQICYPGLGNAFLVLIN